MWPTAGSITPDRPPPHLHPPKERYFQTLREELAEKALFAVGIPKNFGPLIQCVRCRIPLKLKNSDVYNCTNRRDENRINFRFVVSRLLSSIFFIFDIQYFVL